MKSIVICDDEAYIRQELSGYVRRYAEEHGAELCVSTYGSAEELLERLPTDVDILFLDIKMGPCSGMNAARILRERGNNAYLIFVTSMVQFALEGYEVHAFAFLEKPLKYQRFAAVLKDVLSRESRKTLVLRRGNQVDSIPVTSILYVETLDHTSAVVTEGGRREYAISLKKLMEELSASGFGLCHKSFLVNFRKISTLQQNQLILTNGSSIPLSKHRRKLFLEQFTRYMGGQV